jgi:phosphate transport system protein
MAYSGKHISSSFDLALRGLQNDVLMMASLTERLFCNAVDGLVQRNTDVCNGVIADDEEIDVLEKEVDRAGIDTLIRFHPVATHLRRVISQMKLSANLERVADQSVAIARRAKRLNAQAICPEASLLDSIFQHALVQFHDSLRAFVDQDTQLALGLKPRD